MHFCSVLSPFASSISYLVSLRSRDMPSWACASATLIRIPFGVGYWFFATLLNWLSKASDSSCLALMIVISDSERISLRLSGRLRPQSLLSNHLWFPKLNDYSSEPLDIHIATGCLMLHRSSRLDRLDWARLASSRLFELSNLPQHPLQRHTRGATTPATTLLRRYYAFPPSI